MAKNFAYSTVLTAPSPATSGTSLVVQSGDGAKFPPAPFPVTIWPIGTLPTTANAEIAIVTGVSTDTLTITRAQEGTSARTVIVGDQIAATMTADLMIQNNRFSIESATDQTLTLKAGTAFTTPEALQIGSTQSLTVPSTSSLEVLTYAPPSFGNPTGSISMFGGNSGTQPNGWLICDGTAYLRTTYSRLFAVISTNFGIGDGSTTFNVPNFSGRSPMGAGTSAATGATAHTLGSQPTTGIGGEETHVQLTAELAAHQHAPTGGTTSTRIMTPDINNGAAAGSGAASWGAVTLGSTGSSTAFNITHPISVVNFIIKT